MPFRPHPGLLLVLSSWALAGCSDGDAAPRGPVTVAFPGAPERAAGRTLLDDLTLEVTFADGRAAPNVTVELAATSGGTVTPSRVTTDALGVARVDWTLGALPLDNRLIASAGDLGGGSVSVAIDPAATLEPTPFGDIDAWLTERGIDRSTEDLAFSPDGKLVLGYPGGLLTITAQGAIKAFETSGEPLGYPLGLAYDQRGDLFLADTDANALIAVSPSGVARKVTDRDGIEVFLSPNDVAVGEDGTVYLSDPCTGKIYAIAPDTGEIRARLAFDIASEGGPNGLVVGHDGALWATTENTALLCGHDSVELTAPVAGLYRIPLSDGLLGAKTQVATGLGVFGDGLAFDNAGNLYAIFDTVKDFMVDESIVYILPAGTTTPVRGFAVTGRIFANLAFGAGDFGSTTLYLALLAVPPFTEPTARGLERVDIDIGGAPLPPLEDAL
jgi:sugar lactone lactonase YvrE